MSFVLADLILSQLMIGTAFSHVATWYLRNWSDDVTAIS